MLHFGSSEGILRGHLNQRIGMIERKSKGYVVWLLVVALLYLHNKSSEMG